jgi:hypothetical protein
MILLSHGIYIIIGDRAGLYLGLDVDWLGNLSETLVALGPPMSIKDHPLLWMVVRSQTYYPEQILAYESGKTRYSLIMGSGSFRTNYYGWIIGWRSKHRTEVGPQVLGAWSLSLDGDLDLLTGVEWIGLIYAWGINEVCVSGYLAGIH